MSGVFIWGRNLQAPAIHHEHSPETKAESNSASVSGRELARGTQEIHCEQVQWSTRYWRQTARRATPVTLKIVLQKLRPRTPCGGSGKHSALTTAPFSITSFVPLTQESPDKESWLKLSAFFDFSKVLD